MGQAWRAECSHSAIKILAYAGAHFFPRTVPLVCKKNLLLNSKSFCVSQLPPPVSLLLSGVSRSPVSHAHLIRPPAPTCQLSCLSSQSSQHISLSCACSSPDCFFSRELASVGFLPDFVLPASHVPWKPTCFLSLTTGVGQVKPPEALRLS